MSFDPAALLRELYLADGERFFDDPPTVPLFDEPMVGEQGRRYSTGRAFTVAACARRPCHANSAIP